MKFDISLAVNIVPSGNLIQISFSKNAFYPKIMRISLRLNPLPRIFLFAEEL